jgi:hypothetical protein
VDLVVGGNPLTASGLFSNVPVGPAWTVTLEAYPALPAGLEGGVVIYRGQTQVAVTAGQISSASIELYPVEGDVAVTALFPSGDVDVARIDHISVVASGNRIEAPKTYYLALNKASGIATGTALRIPVGRTRTVTVTSFAADGTQLHLGTTATAVAESGAAVEVTMGNTTGLGGISLDGGLCVPACGSSICGDDGCGGSCGGCRPDAQCQGGACVPDCTWQPVAQHSLTAAPAGSTAKTGVLGGQGSGPVGGRTAWLQTSDWNLLFVPTGLADADDVYAFESDFFIEAGAAAPPAFASLIVLTSDSATQCAGGTAQWTGGVLGRVVANGGGSAALDLWDGTAVCSASSVPVAPGALAQTPVGAWHRLRVEGVRSTCATRALLDGAVVTSWSGPCASPLAGPEVALYAGGALGHASNTGWSNFSAFKGSGAACLN